MAKSFPFAGPSRCGSAEMNSSPKQSIHASTAARLLAAALLLTLLSGSAIAAEAPAEGDGKITIGPDYQINPDLTDRGNPKGKAFQFSMRLADSKIFRGDDPTLTPE